MAKDRTTAVTPPELLLVADASDNGMVTAMSLRNAGYRVETASNGHALLEMVRSLRPAVVVTSLRLEGVDGWEATRRLKSDEDTKSIPILVFTGCSDLRLLANATAAGCDAILRKPTSPEALAAQVALLLHPRPPALSAPAPAPVYGPPQAPFGSWNTGPKGVA